MVSLMGAHRPRQNYELRLQLLLMPEETLLLVEGRNLEHIVTLLVYSA